CQVENGNGRGAKAGAEAGGQRSQALADFGSRAQSLRARGTRRRIVARDSGESGLYAGRAVFSFRFQGSDLRRSAARFDRTLAGRGGARGRQNASARGKASRGGDRV